MQRNHRKLIGYSHLQCARLAGANRGASTQPHSLINCDWEA